MFCVKLPHLLTDDDFSHEDDGESMPLADWIETWMGGLTDDVMDGVYLQAEAMAIDMIGLDAFDGFDHDEKCLRNLQSHLTPSQMCYIWRSVLEIN